MPDFADSRFTRGERRGLVQMSPPSGRPSRPPAFERPVHAPGSTSPVKPKESPLSLFTRLMRDFQHGIKTLQNLKFPDKAQSSSTSRPELRATLPEQAIRIPSRPIVLQGSGVERVSLRSRARSLSLLGADREAQRQIAGKYDASPSQLPSAARLAQILRADAVLKSGEGTPNPQVHAWAQAIKEGRRREVADLDPEYVQGAVASALGGSTKAEQLLSSPFIHSLVERHRMALETIHRQLSHTERHVQTGAEARARTSAMSSRMVSGGVSSSGASSGSVSSSGAMPPSSAPASSAGVARVERSRGPDRNYEPDLAHMLATNEEPHLAMAAMSENERAQREIRDVSSSPRGVSSSSIARERGNDRRLAPGITQEASPMRAASEAAGAPRREPAASISAAPGGTSKANAAAPTAQSKPSGNGRMELSGKLTMVGSGGQPMGTADLSMEARS